MSIWESMFDQRPNGIMTAMGLPPQAPGLAGGIAGALANSPPPQMPPAAPPAAPPQEERGFFGRIHDWNKQNPEAMLALAMSLNSMRDRPSQAIAQTLQHGIVSKGKERAATKTANRTADWLEAQGDPRAQKLAALVRDNPSQATAAAKRWTELMTASPKETFEAGNLADGTPIDVNQLTGRRHVLGGGGTNVEINNKLPANISPPEKGYRYVYDKDGRVSHAEVVPGTKADIEAKLQARKSEKLKGQQNTAGYTVVQDLERSLPLIDDFTVDTGVSIPDAVARVGLANVPGTNEYKFTQFKESALSNVGIDQLMQMKFNSPTGGALGQVPFQQQKRLEQLLGSLDIGQDKDVLKDNIARIQNIYLETIHGTKAERQGLLSEGIITPEQYDEVDQMFKELSFNQQGKEKKKDPVKINDWNQVYNLSSGDRYVGPDGVLYEVD